MPHDVDKDRDQEGARFVALRVLAGSVSRPVDLLVWRDGGHVGGRAQGLVVVVISSIINQGLANKNHTPHCILKRSLLFKADNRIK